MVLFYYLLLITCNLIFIGTLSDDFDGPNECDSPLYFQRSLGTNLFLIREKFTPSITELRQPRIENDIAISSDLNTPVAPLFGLSQTSLS
uniref:Uncharacterized protein n=1 Tax=Candidatus Kentrum sp. MB TaxID=2138164 RepID=A0A450X3E3_9GAMM|nr:MAG: hypothetical protein BECKMB1821G_GA0114241_100619 [Candidatus Kentron sp. MB]VFK26696.1 MAG: hypothetical protein BECKMB1821I_GA0114274_100192 [Candidatus Kentron sp. MB]VFK74600.1 MAG: hypothetical protein BECKMB1821H_GA0114242_100719 [Candidatus Kentron sp. MB]